MSVSVESMILERLKNQKEDWDKFVKKQEEKDKELLDEVKKINKHVITQEILNEDNKKTFDSAFERIRDLEKKIKDILKDYVSKGMLKKIIYSVVVGVGVFASAFGVYVTWSQMHQRELERQAKEREAYALSVPSPEQQKEIEKLKKELLKSGKNI